MKVDSRLLREWLLGRPVEERVDWLKKRPGVLLPVDYEAVLEGFRPSPSPPTSPPPPPMQPEPVSRAAKTTTRPAEVPGEPGLEDGIRFLVVLVGLPLLLGGLVWAVVALWPYLTSRWTLGFFYLCAVTAAAFHGWINSNGLSQVVAFLGFGQLALMLMAKIIYS